MRDEAYDVALRVVGVGGGICPRCATHVKLSLFNVWLVLLLLTNAMPLRAQSSNQPLSLAQYRAELEVAIAELEAAPEEKADLVVEELHKRFETMTIVEFSSGEQVQITSIFNDLPTNSGEEFIVDNATAFMTLRDLALAQLRGAVAQIDAAANDNNAARLAILAEVLARPEFNTPMSLWDRFWQWLENFLSEMMPDSRGSGNAAWLSFLIRALPLDHLHPHRRCYHLALELLAATASAFLCDRQTRG